MIMIDSIISYLTFREDLGVYVMMSVIVIVAAVVTLIKIGVQKYYNSLNSKSNYGNVTEGSFGVGNNSTNATEILFPEEDLTGEEE